MLNRYILKFDTSGRMILFVFSLLLIGSAIMFAFSGFSGGVLLNIFSAFLQQESEFTTEAIISGLLFFPVLIFWGMACLVSWASTFALSKELNKGQKLRLASLYFIAFALLANILLPFAVIYLPEYLFHIVMIVVYFAGLKLCDKQIVKSL